MSDHVRGAILVIVIVFLISLVGSWLTIMAVNTLFDLNIPITFETIISITWLTMTLKGIFSNNLTVGPK